MTETPGRDRISMTHLFELLLDWFPDVIHSVDADGRLVYTNRKAMELLGYTREELLDLTIADLYAPEILPKVREGFQKLQEDGNLFVGESVVRDKQGTRIPVEIRSFGVYDPEGRFLRTFSIVRDVRQLKDLQKTLIHQSRLAAIGELASCVAHDISNPLSVIKLYTEWVGTDLQDPEALRTNPEGMTRVADAVGSIDKAADRIEKLVSHLRNFSRSTEVEFEVVELKGVLDDALFMVNSRLQNLNVTVHQDLPEGACIVCGHQNQIEQVFMNLFANACDAMASHPRPELTVSLREVPDELAEGETLMECLVTDCGAGMTEDVLGRAFEAFFTTKERGKGTGLGLPIARNILRRHGGDIQLESEPDQGTTARVTIPPSMDRMPDHSKIPYTG